MNEQGFDATDWTAAEVFTGRCATPTDVDEDRAVFALGDTLDGQAFDEPLPQPAIWYDEADEVGGHARAALIIQAEVHETPDGERLEMLGLLLPSGETRVAFVEDVEEVAAADPVWLQLIEAEFGDAEPDGEADAAFTP